MGKRKKRSGLLFLLVVLIVVLSVVMFHQIVTAPVTQTTKMQPNQPLPTHYSIEKAKQTESNIFVPYWATSSPSDAYNRVYYFGLGFDDSGEIIQDLSLQKINLVSSIASERKMLVVRMLQDRVIDAALGSYEVQGRIVENTLKQVELHNFSGAVLDLEKSYSLNKDTTTQISKFVHYFCSALKKNYKDCFVLVYGDVFYRMRPYDVQEIAKVSDRIIIMAYDFHKAGGEPGPNFPFVKGDYGYDFKQMIADFSSVVPKEKLEVAFGMFGYDWTLNDQGTPLKSATAFSVQSLKSKVESLKNDTRYMLRVTRNASQEPRIDYIDGEGRGHVVWYEDEESVKVKTDFLHSQGIGMTSFWAWEYFDGV